MPTTRRTILLKGDPRYDEKVAAGAITPGMLLMENSDGKVVVHGTEGGYAERIIAIEDSLQGKEIDDAYAADDPVRLNHCQKGDEAYMFIKAGENIDEGDELISAGDGTLIEDTSITSGGTVKDVVAIASEAVNLTASGASNTRIKVRFR